MNLTATEQAKLLHLHPDLRRVVERAARTSPISFAVLEVLRTEARQRELVAKGASRTMKSRHLPGADGFSHAVDLAPKMGGAISWDWPLYNKLAPIIKAAAAAEKVPIEWGGDWRTFRDGPHWQLPWKYYP